MKATDPPLDSADRALFRQAMQSVRPLARDTRSQAAQARPESPDILQARRRHAQGPDAQARAWLDGTDSAPWQAAWDADDTEAGGHYLRAGCGTDLLRGLRRGKWAPEAALDLHGCTQDQARERLDHFLATCLQHGIRCVRVIHGKGMGSRDEPVLKTAVRQHLGRLAAVQAWVQCSEPQGGAGAVHVLLRAPAGR